MTIRHYTLANQYGDPLLPDVDLPVGTQGVEYKLLAAIIDYGRDRDGYPGEGADRYLRLVVDKSVTLTSVDELDNYGHDADLLEHLKRLVRQELERRRRVRLIDEIEADPEHATAGSIAEILRDACQYEIEHLGECAPSLEDGGQVEDRVCGVSAWWTLDRETFRRIPAAAFLAAWEIIQREEVARHEK